jgi:hypothetical protein
MRLIGAPQLPEVRPPPAPDLPKRLRGVMPMRRSGFVEVPAPAANMRRPFCAPPSRVPGRFTHMTILNQLLLDLPSG